MNKSTFKNLAPINVIASRIMTKVKDATKETADKAREFELNDVNIEKVAEDVKFISTIVGIGSLVHFVAVGPKKYFKTIFSLKYNAIEALGYTIAVGVSVFKNYEKKEKEITWSEPTVTVETITEEQMNEETVTEKEMDDDESITFNGNKYLYKDLKSPEELLKETIKHVCKTAPTMKLTDL